MSYEIKQSSTAYPLLFLMVDSTDHITAKTGLSPTVTISKAGGSFASPSGSVTEIANGWYKVAGNATDSGTLGPLVLHATGTGADPVDVIYRVVAHDVQDAVHLGLSSLPNVAADSDGGLIVIGTSTRQLNPSAGGVPISFGGRQQIWDFLFADMTLTSGSIGKLIQDYLDAAISSRLASGSYTAPDNSSITAIKAKTDNLPSDPADASDIAAAFSTVNSTLSTIAGYIDTEVAAIKAKTDNLPASPAATGDAMTLTSAYDAAKTAAQAGDDMGLTAGAITTSTFAAGAIDAAAIATDAIGSLELAAGAATEIAAAVASAVSTTQTRCRVEAAMTSSAGSEVRMLAWLEQNGERVVLPSGTCSIEVREHGSGSALFTATDSAPNARGVFELTQSSPGFTNDRLYAATVTIVDDSSVSHVTIEAFPVFG